MTRRIRRRVLAVEANGQYGEEPDPIDGLRRERQGAA